MNSSMALKNLQQTTYEIENRIATVTLNRPDKLNAFTVPMMGELLDILADIDANDEVRAAIFTGAGRAFCAGADLGSGGSTFDAGTLDPGRKLGAHRDEGGRVSLGIYECRKPIIAAINGPAVGIGITMTLPMDIRIASEDAKIGFVFTRRGIVPEACSSWFLPRIVGLAKAAELCYTGRVFRAGDEAESGLFNAVVPGNDVLPKARALADEIAENTSAVSVALAKRLLQSGAGYKDPYQSHLIDSKCIYWTGARGDSYEGVQSFLEKRKPDFKLSARDDMPDFYPWRNLDEFS